MLAAYYSRRVCPRGCRSEGTEQIYLIVFMFLYRLLYYIQPVPEEAAEKTTGMISLKKRQMLTMGGIYGEIDRTMNQCRI